MKLFGPIMLAAMCVMASAQEPSASESSKIKTREGFVYSESKKSEKPEPPEPPAPLASEGDVVVMEAVTVTESIARRELDRSIRERAAAEAAEKFQWNRGGLIGRKKIGNLNADLGLWPTLESTVPGKLGSQGVMLRVEVLHLRW